MKEREIRRDYRDAHDLRKKLIEKRDSITKNVWNRLDDANGNHSEVPRSRERYHPYQRDSGVYIREKIRDTASSSEGRPKFVYENRNEKQTVMRYERQTEKHWERSRNTSSRNRASPDSQRTVSDAPRRAGISAYYRGQNSRTPPPRGYEWRPVNRARETEVSHGLLKRNEVTKDPIRSSGEKIQGDETTRRTPTETRGHELENKSSTGQEASNQDKEKSLDTTPLSGEVNAILNESQDTRHEQENEVEKEVGETQQEKRRREDMELEKSIEEYANMVDLAMTKDIVNDEDLLDEHLELEHPRDEDMEDERIEAISQLSLEPQTTKSLSRWELREELAARTLKEPQHQRS
ncbi:hypothetical protein HID58_040451 [Brassica napus]|uniref:Uncharacterized protein n=1 Tax=Brassica napus TaxID=3708 RepID=A0ABQ8B8A4_BRANA|nr:hypothetical protein HID58_040451 [Brassica napus]